MVNARVPKDKRTKPALASRKAALTRAVLLSIALLPICIGAWLIASLWLAFGHGADFGGYGAGASDPEPWVRPLTGALLVCAVGIDVLAGFVVYRRKRHRI